MILIIAVKYNMTKEINLLSGILKYIDDSVNKLLSKVELEVYKLMKDGINYKEIANILGKTPKQIDNTIQRIRIKLKKLK